MNNRFLNSAAAFQLAVAFLLAQVFVIASTWRFLPTQLPLFYSRPWGEDQLTRPVGLLLIPLASLITIILNLVLGRLFSKEEEFPKQILAVASVVFSFLGLITLIQVVRLVM